MDTKIEIVFCAVLVSWSVLQYHTVVLKKKNKRPGEQVIYNV